MKIIIFSPTSTVFDLNDGSKCYGGADSALLKMIEVLATEHEVEAFIPMPKSDEGEFREANCQPFMDLFDGKRECDILIMYRKVWAVPNTVKYKKLIFYSQDTVDTPCFNNIKNKDCFRPFDRVIVLSKFHRENFQSLFDYPVWKTLILGNATEEMEKIEKQPLNFIYFSTPFRGLVVLMKMWKTIIKKYPTAKLHVFSSMAIYGAKNLDDLHFKAMLDGLERMEGVTSHGSRPHEEVMQQLQKSFMLLYPNTYPETFCNVIMESRAAHTPFITTDKGALKETGGAAGIYVKGNPYTEKYQNEFISYVDQMIKSENAYKNYQENCYPVRTWKDYAQDLLTEINRLKEEIKD